MDHSRRGTRAIDVSPRKGPSRITATFFKAPIDALSDSLKTASFQSEYPDLIEAYSIFADRLKTFLSSADFTEVAAFTALDPIRSHAHAISRCMVRDIGRAFRRHPLNDGGPHTERFAEDRRNTLVAHLAMQLLSCIFAVPTLSALFSADDLGGLLNSLLHILQAGQSLGYNAIKSRSFATWVLSTQQLNVEVICGHRESLIAVLKMTMLEKEVGEQLLGDCFKASHNLLTRHPSLFYVPASELLSLVLAHLVSPVRLLRLRAAYALAGLTHATVWSLATLPSDRKMSMARTCIRRRILDFAEVQGARTKNPSTAKTQTLRDLFAASLPQKNTDACGPDAPWVISVLGSFIVLSEGYFFTSPPLLKMMIQCSLSIRNHDSKPLRSLHSFIWRCLIWAFAQTPHVKDCPPSNNPAETAEQNFRRKVLKTLRQDGRQGVRTALVYALLSMDPSPSDSDSPVALEHEGIRDSLDVIRDLVTNSHKALLIEGLGLLRRLSSAVGSPPNSEAPACDMRRILPMELLGGPLAHVQVQDLPRLVRKLTDFDVNNVRPLTEAEVNAHWEELIGLWETGVQRAVNNNMEVTPEGDLCATWRALLLVKTQLTQAHGHIAATPDFAKKAIGIIKSFNVGSTSHMSAFVQCLQTTRQLWRIMKLVFCDHWLSEAADDLVKAVLSIDEHSPAAEADKELESFCAELMLSSSPDILATLDEARHYCDRRRQLWSLAAEGWKSTDSMRSWHDISVFLSVPLRLWSMSSPEQDLWAEVLEQAIVSAKTSGSASDEVLEALFTQIPPHSIPADIIPLFIFYLTLKDEQHVPTITLTHLNDFLLADTTQPTQSILCIYSALATQIKSCSPPVAVRVLEILGDGLTTWISAERGVFTEEEYEDNIATFYCNAVHKLAESPELPDDILITLDEKFLCSPIESCRSHACIHALEDLCEAVRQRVDIFDDVFPAYIRAALAAWYDVVGGPRPSFVPEESQLPSQLSSSEVDELVETSVAGEMSLSPVEDANDDDDEFHVAGADELPDLSYVQRHVFSDALRINRVVDKGDEVHKGRVLGLAPLPPSMLLDGSNLVPRTVLGKRSAMPEPEVIAERKRPRIALEDEENRDVSSNAMSVQPQHARSGVAPSEVAITPSPPEGAGSPDGEGGETSLPSPPCTVDPGTVLLRSQSLEVAYEGPEYEETQPEVDELESLESTPGITRTSSEGLDENIHARKTRDAAASRSASLHMLEKTLKALEDDENMPIEDVLSAQEAVQEIERVLIGKLARRLKRP